MVQGRKQIKNLPLGWCEYTFQSAYWKIREGNHSKGISIHFISARPCGLIEESFSQATNLVWGRRVKLPSSMVEEAWRIHSHLRGENGKILVLLDFSSFEACLYPSNGPCDITIHMVLGISSILFLFFFLRSLDFCTVFLLLPGGIL